MPPEQDQQQEKTEAEKSPLATAVPEADAADQTRSEKPVRPEGLPDDFWSDETGADLAKLTASYKELADFKTAADTAAAGRPQKADDFKAVLPEDFKAPDGVEVKIDEKDPRLPVARELALKLGLDQQGFSQILALDAQFKLAEQAQLAGRLKEELTKLGTQGKARVDAVTSWLGAKLGNELGNALIPMLYTEKQVKAFEKIIAAAKGSVPDFNAGNREQADSAISDEEYDAMTRDQQIIYARTHPSKTPTQRVRQAAGGRG